MRSGSLEPDPPTSAALDVIKIIIFRVLVILITSSAAEVGGSGSRLAKWYHLNCARLTTIPEGDWYCVQCS